eukprot:TRINITY_DN16970_c0_g3_i1.p1 TRINITY_DN16970_c0_g3~~TRINITY_DN16970_c0_g3_i1.p1  ORF type:complete len:626 (-),score=61.99 TRINITY_DN16970_c0_g3_i1:247-2124(-)
MSPASLVWTCLLGHLTFSACGQPIAPHPGDTEAFPKLPHGLLPKWPQNASSPSDPDVNATVFNAGPVVVTANGPVQGVYRGFSRSSVSWWGVPFAEPPVGELRLRSPRPLERTWTEPLQANRVPAACTDSEDCLYMNVYTPSSALRPGSTPLPVMYWIYGGGFVSGTNFEVGLYDGRNLCEKHNVVVVAVNYRLGNLGFMALDALKNEDPNYSTGNYGTQDQALGLQWVKANIKAFGGDPDQMTIFGESAGGMSVMWHLVSPSSAGLFHAAIMESGTSQLSFFFQAYTDARDYHEDVVKSLGCPASSVADAQLKCLRALPMKAILKGAKSPPSKRSPFYPIMPVGPVIDRARTGTLDTPMHLVVRGNFNKVPLIVGANEDGGTVFEPMVPRVVPGAQWPATLFKGTVRKAIDYMMQGSASFFQSLYNVSEYKSAEFPEDALLSRSIRDLIFMCPLRQLASAYARQGIPAYMYVFHFNYGLLIDKVLHLGDFHAGELPFVFNNWLDAIDVLAPLQEPRLMSDIMSCKWSSFAYTHNPNGGTDESTWPPGCLEINRKYSSWPQFTTRDRLFYSLKIEPEVLQIRSDNYYPDDIFPRDSKCDMIDSISFDLFFRNDGQTQVQEAITLV